MLWAELSQFVADYWHEVDHNAGARAHEFFIPHGVFMTSTQIYEGQDAIQEFYQKRSARGDRTARHLVNNLRIARATDDEVTIDWVLCLYAHDGLPVQASAPPILIADVSDCCVQTQGGWRLRSRQINPVFKGGVSTTS